MTRVADSGWRAAPDVLVAAPLRAVDVHRTRREADTLIITARVAVRGDEPYLRGHFPGLAVFPGVFVVEALCQAMADAVPEAALRVLRSVRFLAPLLDGDELTLQITAGPAPVGGGWDVRAEGTRRDGTTTARIRAEFAPAGPPDA